MLDAGIDAGRNFRQVVCAIGVWIWHNLSAFANLLTVSSLGAGPASAGPFFIPSNEKDHGVTRGPHSQYRSIRATDHRLDRCQIEAAPLPLHWAELARRIVGMAW